MLVLHGSGIIAEEKKDAKSQRNRKYAVRFLYLLEVSVATGKVSNMPKHDLSKENNNRHVNMARKGHSGGLSPRQTTQAKKEC